MKSGDQFQVVVEGLNVGTAVVEYVEDGKATIFIPATRFTAATKTQLVDQPREGGTQHIMTGVDQAPPAPVVEAPAAPPTEPVVEEKTSADQETK